MSLFLRVNESFVDPQSPKMRSDPILTEGSLLLAEAAHSADPWTEGVVPADSTLMPNIAWQEALEALGSGVEADVKPTFKKTVNFTGSLAKAERSAKGGLHGILTQSAYTSGDVYMSLMLPTALLDYIVANSGNNTGHDWYTSVWGRITRATLPGTIDGTYINGVTASRADVLMAILRSASGTPTGMVEMATGTGQNYPSSSRLIGGVIEGGGGSYNPSPTQGASAAVATLAPTGPYFQAVAGKTNETMVAANYTNGRKTLMWHGVASDSYTVDSNLLNRWKSWVWYRTYIEDLTVSGRSWSTVEALDKALYDQHVKTAGGRYYGDTTPTSPASIA